ncbi:MAG: hypothetical protein BWK76_17955 [Desulfobulbaceae bacterium A2]|nr:MAG: hypothetical protein BWK76_17955 [Desulfobulbaceae bacterium A2]
MQAAAQPIHRYRPDIDGLRAVAVLMVLIFHAFPESLPGGFIGVDIFFVISGYLISSLILADLRGGHFSFRDFYARRIRRIFPALILVLATSYLLGWFFLLPDEYMGLGKHIAGGAGFISNFVLLAESGYFDRAAELKPLLHLWSLGIEEQFYFIWPLLLAAAWGRRFAPLGLILLLLTGSFFLNVDGVHGNSGSTYYLPFTRFWELMIGCLLGYVGPGAQNALTSRLGQAKNGADIARVLRNAASLAGVACIVAAGVFINRQSSFPGWWALLPTLGAFLLIAAGPLAWLNRSWLSHPFMVFTGLVSFPLYLWHWPLLTFPRLVSIDPPSPALRAAALVVSFLLAWLTFRFVERPIRSCRAQARIVPILCLLMALVLTVGYGTYHSGGIAARMREKADYSAFFSNLQYTRSHDLVFHDRHECNFYDILTNKPKPAIDPGCYTPRSKNIVFLWGDSHAQHLNYGLQATHPKDVSLLQVGSSGCPPSAVDFAPDPLMTCNRANRFALEKIEELRPGTVILAQSIKHETNDYDGLTARLKKAGVRNIVLIGPVPHWQPDLYKLIVKKYWGHIPTRLQAHLRESVLYTDRVLQERYRDSRQLRYISLVSQLCNAEGCLTHLNDDPWEGLISYDDGHFTLEASRYVVEQFIAPILFSKSLPQTSQRDSPDGRNVRLYLTRR